MKRKCNAWSREKIKHEALHFALVNVGIKVICITCSAIDSTRKVCQFYTQNLKRLVNNLSVLWKSLPIQMGTLPSQPDGPAPTTAADTGADVGPINMLANVCVGMVFLWVCMPVWQQVSHLAEYKIIDHTLSTCTAERNRMFCLSNMVELVSQRSLVDYLALQQVATPGQLKNAQI